MPEKCIENASQEHRRFTSDYPDMQCQNNIINNKKYSSTCFTSAGLFGKKHEIIIIINFLFKASFSVCLQRKHESKNITK